MRPVERDECGSYLGGEVSAIQVAKFLPFGWRSSRHSGGEVSENKHSGLRHGKPYCNECYYISSVQTSAAQWQSLIQDHWGIENRLHWPKDVIFDEDKTRLENPNALLAWSIIRSFIINILRLRGYQFLKPTLTKLANRVDLIFPLLQ